MMRHLTQEECRRVSGGAEHGTSPMVPWILGLHRLSTLRAAGTGYGLAGIADARMADFDIQLSRLARDVQSRSRRLRFWR